MDAQALRWGLLGTARINRALISPLRASKRNRLEAVASRSQAGAETYGREWGISRTFGSYAAMLADPQIDVIYNSLPNHLHAEWTIKALEAGKHVLCEKPLALSVAEVDAIAAASKKAGRIVAEAFMYRHHPQTLKVKEIVESGVLGQLRLIRGAFTFMLDRPGNYRNDPNKGGGSIWDVGCYPISYARLLAREEPLEVFGWQVTGASGIDEAFFGQMRFPGEVYAQFDSGFKSPFRSQIEIIGSQAALSVPTPFKPGESEKLILSRDDQTDRLRVRGQALYQGEVEDMADAILLGKPARIALADSRANVAAIVALLKSARTGKPVSLE